MQAETVAVHVQRLVDTIDNGIGSIKTVRNQNGHMITQKNSMKILRVIIRMRTKRETHGRMIERSSVADFYIGFSNVGLSYVGKSNAIK